VKRMNLSAHHVIAEAAKNSEELLAQQMKAMAEASHEVEYGKIDVQLKLFAEKMDYQHEKDRRLYESSRIAQENAHLSIIKHGEVVQALSKLSGVLHNGLLVSPDSKESGIPQPAPNQLPLNPTANDCTSAPRCM
jgi:hypothetical protein